MGKLKKVFSFFILSHALYISLFFWDSKIKYIRVTELNME